MKLHLSSLICGASSARDAAQADAGTSSASRSGASHRGHDVRVSSGSGQEPAPRPSARRSAFGRLGRAMRNALPGGGRRQERPQGPPERVPLAHYLAGLRASEGTHAAASAGAGHEHETIASTSGQAGAHEHVETHGEASTSTHRETVTTQSSAQGAGGAAHHDPETHEQMLRIKAGFDAKRQAFDKRMGIASHPKSKGFLACFGKIGGSSSSRPSQPAAGGRTQGTPTQASAPPPSTGHSGRSEGAGASGRSAGAGASGRIPSGTASERSPSLRSEAGSASASPGHQPEHELPSLTQAASDVQSALALILREASPEVREGSAQAGALLREEPVELPLSPIAQHVRNALDQAARELSDLSETESFVTSDSEMSDDEVFFDAQPEIPAHQRSPSQSSDEDAAFFRSMENELGHHIATASNADELGAADFDRLMTESPRRSEAGSDEHRDWQIVPQEYRRPDEQTDLHRERGMVPSFAPEHRPAYFVEEPEDSEVGSPHHELEGAMGRHDPNMPRIEEIVSPRTEGVRDHIIIDIHDDTPPTSPRAGGATGGGRMTGIGGATGAGGAGGIGATSGASGAAAPSRIAQAVGSIRSMLQHVMNNDFTHPLPRWGANIAHAAMRDGATVFVATALREVVGYLVQQATTRGTAHAQAQGPSHLAASEHAQVLASAGIIAGVAGLNLLSLAYNGRSQRQTARSVPSQAFNLAALGAASAAAYGTGTLGAVMPLLAKAVAYTGLRDGMNLFTSLSSNREQLAPHASQSNMAANWAEMVVYSANQFVVSTLQNTPASHSGTSSWAQEHSLHQVIPHMLAFAAANAGGEIADSTVYPALEAFADAGGGRAGLHAVGQTRLTASLRTPMSTAASQNIPTHEAIARHLLGPFTARTTMFATLYATAGALGRLHPERHFSETGVTQVTTAILSMLTGMLVVPFITSLDTQAAPQAQHQHENEEPDLELGFHRPA